MSPGHPWYARSDGRQCPTSGSGPDTLRASGSDSHWPQSLWQLSVPRTVPAPPDSPLMENHVIREIQTLRLTRRGLETELVTRLRGRGTWIVP